MYWEAQTQDAFGNIIDEDYGNGTTTIRSFDGVTGRLDYIDTDNGALQDLTYSWDKVGNLESRKDWRQTGNPTELFGYDSLNRLTDADVSGAATFNLGIHYDENGNIDVKDDLGAGTWTYHTSNKHAVISAGGNSYGYDDNGNMTSRKGDTITWTSYNYPSEIDDGPRTYQYSYDADRQKWKQVFDDGSTSETTYFAGRAFEKNVNSSDTDHRHYVMANGRAVAMFVERSSQSDYVRYFTHDHLGSTDGIVFDNGTLDVAESFSAFGERRDPTDWVGDPPASDFSRIADLTDRGYTDHISLEESTLVHMNGRVYDAEIGRFLSPDPYVANPMNTQGFNRYAYVQNNPMRYTDPSGFEGSCLGDWFSCTATFIAFATDFFGGSNYVPPPHDHCKDNTQGCGGVAQARLNSYMPAPPSLPRKRRIRIVLGSGGVSVGVNFGGPGTGNPIVIWANNSEQRVEKVAEQARDELRGGTWFIGPGAALVGGLFGNDYGSDIAIQLAVSIGPEGLDAGIIYTRGHAREGPPAQLDLSADVTAGMIRGSLSQIEGSGSAVNIGVRAPAVGVTASGIYDEFGEQIGFQVGASAGPPYIPLTVSETTTRTRTITVRGGLDWARAKTTDALCAISGRC